MSFVGPVWTAQQEFDNRTAAHTMAYGPRYGPNRGRRYASSSGPLVVRHGYGGSRGRYKSGYGGTRRRAWGPGYSRQGGFYGRFRPGPAAGGELKFFDVTLDDAVIAAGGAITDSINLIAQGITESTRGGRKCTIKSIYWRYHVTLPEVNDAADPGLPDTIRMILYVDKQANGATAAVTDILADAQFQAFRNLANSQRFAILLDKQITMNYLGLAGGTVAGAVAQTHVNRDGTFFKKCNIPLEFSDTTGAITEIRSNNIGVLLISQAGIGGFLSQFRLRFSDASAFC